MMILWLNGTYGVGKTTIANKISERYSKNSKVFDPDLIWKQTILENPMIVFGDGAYPRDNKRFLTILIDSINKMIKNCDGLVIIPMTIVNESIFRSIIENINIKIKHIILLAKEEVIRERVEMQEEASNENRDLSTLTNDIMYLNKNFINDYKIDTSFMNIENITARIIGIL